MRNLITIAFICLSFAGFTQTEKKVEKNDQKIDELNKRLDNLIGGSKSIKGDSIEFKLDLLMREIAEIKTEMNEIKKSVDFLKSGEQTKLNSINSRVQEIENGEYYVVVASAVDEQRANNLERVYNKNHSVTVVRNTRGSWYHVILSNPFSMKNAIKETTKMKQGQFKDAWWVSGKKLKEI